MEDRIRAFIAIPLPRQVKDTARMLQRRLQEAGVRMRWVKPGAMHLTLRFLGDIDENRVPGIEKTLAETVNKTDPPALSVKGIGVFPNVKKARVFWMGIAGRTPRLFDIRNRLENKLARLGYETERRRFSAHLTLGRARGRLDPRLLVRCIETIGGFQAVPFTARKLVLYKSDLRPDGAVYTALAVREFVRTV